MKFNPGLAAVVLVMVCFAFAVSAFTSGVQPQSTFSPATNELHFNRGQISVTLPTPDYPYHSGSIIGDLHATSWFGLGLQYYSDDSIAFSRFPQIRSVEFSIYDGTYSTQIQSAKITGVSFANSTTIFYAIPSSLDWYSYTDVTVNIAFRTTFVGGLTEDQFSNQIKTRFVWTSTPGDLSTAIAAQSVSRTFGISPSWLNSTQTWDNYYLSLDTHSDSRPLDDYGTYIFPSTISENTHPYNISTDDIFANNWSIKFPWKLDLSVPNTTLSVDLTGNGVFTSSNYDQGFYCSLNDIAVSGEFQYSAGSKFTLLALTLDQNFVDALGETDTSSIELKCHSLVIYIPRDRSASLTLEPAAVIQTSLSHAIFYAPLKQNTASPSKLLVIILATVFGVLGLLAVAGILVCCCVGASKKRSNDGYQEAPVEMPTKVTTIVASSTVPAHFPQQGGYYQPTPPPQHYSPHQHNQQPYQPHPPAPHYQPHYQPQQNQHYPPQQNQPYSPQHAPPFQNQPSPYYDAAPPSSDHNPYI